MDAIYLKIISLFLWIIVVFGEALVESRSVCDFALCVSPALKKATTKNDKRVICTELGPTLKCMEGQLPSCHKTMGRFSTMDHEYEEMYLRLKEQYQSECRIYEHSFKVNGKCSQFQRCLKSDKEHIKYTENVETLCEVTPKIILCFEDALHECKKSAGKANQAKIDQLEVKLEEMRKKTLVTCGSNAPGFQASFPVWMLVLLATLFRFLQVAILS